MSATVTSFNPAIGRAVRVGDALIGALLELASTHGDLLFHEERSWASSTFRGVRHRIMIAFEGPSAVAGGDAMSAALAEHEFAIDGWLVTHAAVVATDRRYGDNPRLTVTAELLMLESD